MPTQVVRGASFGGPGGRPFDDFAAAAPQISSVRSIVVSAGTFVDRIETTYTLTDGRPYTAIHGGRGGRATTVNLAPDERLIGVRGRSGALIDQIAFVTSSPRGIQTYGPFGGPGGSPFDLRADVVAFYGASGDLLDRLGFYVRSHFYGMFGGGGGRYSEDPVGIAGSTEIRQIAIRAGAYIDAISTTYATPGGTVVRSHGGGGGERHVINFQPGERITGVYGRTGAYLDSIGFFSEDRAGNRRTHGPFGGGGGGNPFALNRDILSFACRSGGLIDAIGFYTA